VENGGADVAGLTSEILFGLHLRSVFVVLVVLLKMTKQPGEGKQRQQIP
jgi:hypothetical protein